MELRQIQYLCAVVETGSFTRAAERCLVSQSAISQQVKALEAELGFELLHRHAPLCPPDKEVAHLAEASRENRIPDGGGSADLAVLRHAPDLFPPESVFKNHLSGHRFERAEQGGDQRAFSGSARPNQRNVFPLADRQGDPRAEHGLPVSHG